MCACVSPGWENNMRLRYAGSFWLLKEVELVNEENIPVPAVKAA